MADKTGANDCSRSAIMFQLEKYRSIFTTLVLFVEVPTQV